MHQRPGSRVSSGRHLAVAIVVIAALLAVLLPGIASGARQGPPRMGEFLWGMAGQESGWDYKARNRWSGAYGRYQVMPQNWPAWAKTYLGDRWADQSPRNQELVVRGKIADLHRWLGSWRRVAYWWLTGDTERDERRWTSYARGYVDNVMTLARRAPEGGDPVPPEPAADLPAADRGDWRLVVHGAVLFTRIDGEARRRVTRVRDGQVLFVQGTRFNRRDVLWLKASTDRGKVGWVSIRVTVPARRPTDAASYPRGREPGPGGRDERPRRPRPR